MKKTTLLTINFLLFLTSPAFLLAVDSQEPCANVNCKYTVESVRVSGVPESKISKKLNDEMQKMVGEKFSQTVADDLGKKLEKELSDYSVSMKVRRGDKTEHVKVVYETERIWWKKFDINRSKFVYHSKEGWSGILNATLDSHHNAFTFGFINTADELLERDAGLRLAYEHRKLGTDHLRLLLDFRSLHEKWNPATENALASDPLVPGVYRNRQDFAPAIAVLPIPDLQISFGTSFQRFQTQYPSVHTQTAYAGTLGFRLRHTFRNPSSGWSQRIDTGYTVRSATRTLDSDYVYTRHEVQADYTLSHRRNHLDLRVIAGGITGRAPLFERFSLGNAETLRGWNKFDVAPLGGDRVAYASIGYRYRDFNVFYDTGAVWDAGMPARVHHAIGFGYRDKDGAFLLLGFPVRLHQVVPVVTFGIRF